MSKVLPFILGIVVGVVGLLAAQNPAKVADSARSGITAAQKSVESVNRDHCKKEFLEKSQCFMNKPAKECDALISKTCGPE